MVIISILLDAELKLKLRNSSYNRHKFFDQLQKLWRFVSVNIMCCLCIDGPPMYRHIVLHYTA